MAHARWRASSAKIAGREEATPTNEPIDNTDTREQAASELTDTELAYGRFVPRQFLQLLGRPSIVDVQLGDNVEQEMTLLFSDIRDFTALSESILPAENFRFINSYLSTMEPVVARNHGIVDKFIGDGIMALFAGPADDGVRAGIDMLRQLELYNQGRARAGYAQIRIGVGVNTGLVMMGTIGGYNRMDSTVIGDAVNLASRLEGLTKSYATPMMISAHTLHALRDPALYCIRFLDRVAIKGRYQAQSVYEVFDADRAQLRDEKLATRPDFERALAYYHVGRPDLAQPLLEQCRRRAPGDTAVQVYLDRCGEAAAGRTDAAGRIEAEIAWRPDFSVGIGEIDAHHQELLAAIARLAGLVSGGKPGTGELLAHIGICIDRHFAHEQRQMLRHDYPFRHEHEAQHATFRRLFAEMRQEIENGTENPLYLLFQIQLLLVDWKINHIAKSDTHLGNFLLRAGMH